MGEEAGAGGDNAGSRVDSVAAPTRRDAVLSAVVGPPGQSPRPDRLRPGSLARYVAVHRGDPTAGPSAQAVGNARHRGLRPMPPTPAGHSLRRSHTQPSTHS